MMVRITRPKRNPLPLNFSRANEYPAKDALINCSNIMTKVEVKLYSNDLG